MNEEKAVIVFRVGDRVFDARKNFGWGKVHDVFRVLNDWVVNVAFDNGDIYSYHEDDLELLSFSEYAIYDRVNQVRPIEFKDGDVVVDNEGWIAIYHGVTSEGMLIYYLTKPPYDSSVKINKYPRTGISHVKYFKIATKDQQNKIWVALAKKNKYWDAENKEVKEFKFNDILEKFLEKEGIREEFCIEMALQPVITNPLFLIPQFKDRILENSSRDINRMFNWQLTKRGIDYWLYFDEKYYTFHKQESNNPKVGDIGLFYDNVESQVKYVDKHSISISKLVGNIKGMFIDDTGWRWKYFFKVSPSETIVQIRERFLKENGR